MSMRNRARRFSHNSKSIVFSGNSLCNNFCISFDDILPLKDDDSINNQIIPLCNQYNEVISQQRSEAVRDYMIEHGVEAEALTAMGYGESRPLDRAETYEAWAKNRRMEFKVSERR